MSRSCSSARSGAQRSKALMGSKGPPVFVVDICTRRTPALPYGHKRDEIDKLDRIDGDTMSAHDDDLPPLPPQPPPGDERVAEHVDPNENMPAGEAEHTRGYTRLHKHIERLRADKRPRRPRQLTPEEASAYQMAARLRAAAPNAAEPRPE